MWLPHGVSATQQTVPLLGVTIAADRVGLLLEERGKGRLSGIGDISLVEVALWQKL